MKKIDTQGMSCPQPVLMTKQALQGNWDHLSILVDNETAKENVLRFVTNEGFSCEVCATEEGYQLEVRK